MNLLSECNMAQLKRKLTQNLRAQKVVTAEIFLRVSFFKFSHYNYSFISLYITTYANTTLLCFQVSLYYSMKSRSHGTHTQTHIPQLNSTTVVVRSSLGSPLISPRLLCLLSRPTLHAEPVFNMAAHPGSQSNNKLYLQLSAGLNHWDYCSTKCWDSC